MAATDGLLSVLEKCWISPPSNTVGERSLPLTFLDLAWLLFPPVHQLFFYDFPHSKPHFIQTIIPNLKHSLSITLQHFFPFASNIIVFPDKNHLGLSRKPEIHHVEGDSLPLTVAECGLDFNYLKGNHPRECNKFHPLVPLLEDAFKVSDLVKIPVFSIQVTIFPNSGITIGLTNIHTLCDARTRYDFLMAWTSIAKHGTDELFLVSGSMPIYDRMIKYPRSLDEMLLSLPPIQALDETYKAPQLASQINKVRATFGCGPTSDPRTCIIVHGKEGEYEIERFGCAADLRARLDPPVPQTYFGNVLGLCVAPTRTTVITGNRGFPNAVDLIGKAIREALNSKEGVFKDAETWLEKSFLPLPTIAVAGTPKLNAYAVDFGWGKPKKYETISLDFNDSISVNASKDSPEDLEIGVCLPPKQMDAFLTISKNELERILSEEQ